jgi:hypothetical protein
MTEPAAARLAIHDPPRLSLECLLALRHVLDGVLTPSVATKSDKPRNRPGNI